jgi:hypothetical protein
VLQASVIAQRTHLKEKLDALRNALINIALTQTPDETLESIFLGYIYSFTEWHIRILRFYESPKPRIRLSEVSQIIEQTYPELRGRSDIYETIWTDLYQKGLVDMHSLHGPIDSSVKNKRATELGKTFLKFIADPVNESAAL